MPALDPQLRKLLTSLRGRVRRYIVADSLLAVVAFIFAAFWIGLAIDFIPVRLGGTEMPRSARTVLLVAVGISLLVMTLRLLVGRLQRPLPDDSLALLIERHHPEIGGRLVTAVQLEQGGRMGDAHAPALLRRVHAEAAAAVGGVDSNRIFRWQPLIRKVWLVVPMMIATIAFAVVSPSAFGRAAGRLLLITDKPWPRQAALEMVGVELPVVGADEAAATPPKVVTFEDGVARLPRGSSGTLRVLARAEDAIVPEVCTVYFTTDGGIRGQANMRRVGRVTDGYQAFLLDGPPLAGLTESVTITVRGLDARLDDYRIEAVEPPALNRLQVVTTDPNYLRPIGQDGEASTTRSVDYQAGLRVREGARAELRARSSVPLGRVDARMLVGNSDAQTPPITVSADGSEFSLVLDDMRQPATIIVVPEDRDGISAQVPYRYFLGVVTDEKPEIELRLKGIGTAVTRNARLPIFGTAKDDYEIDKSFATLSVVDKNDVVAATDEQGEPVARPTGDENVRRSVNLPIRGDRDGKFELTIDLRDLAEDKNSGLAIPEPGGAINVIGEASDRYDLDGRVHRATSQLYKLDIVTPENLLALLERRELALRSRLEQTIEETRQLRDSLSGLRPDLEAIAASPANAVETEKPSDSAGDEAASGDTQSESENDESADSAGRERQVVRLRTQQIGLQAAKTSEELQGIATSLDDLLEEMANNRVDSIDRSERIGGGVRDPLRAIVAGDLTLLRSQIAQIEKRIAGQDAKLSSTSSTQSGDAASPLTADLVVAVESAERVLLQLTAVLEKMLDLESFNEILDMVRELIDSQEGLIEKTKKEQKTRVLDLFD
ncbi:MAG TPA: polyketide synthase [Planctomycetaceae bacterium]|nr:polyketide synthase [Planctomycetaceae bacterium]